MKPNIRGLPRSHMKPGLLGWSAKSGDLKAAVLVRYRFPFSRNWLIRAALQPSAQLNQSRTGYVYLISPKVKIHTDKHHARLAVFIAASVVVPSIPIIWPAFSLETQEIKKVESRSLDALPKCSEGDFESLPALQSALSGLPSDLTVLEKRNSSQLGGYRGTEFRMQCENQIQEVFVSEVRIGSTWKIKKVARLEN